MTRWLATLVLTLCACGWIAVGIRLVGAQGASQDGGHHSEDFLGNSHDLGGLGFLLVGILLVGLVVAVGHVVGPLAWTTVLAFVVQRRGVLAKPSAIVLGMSCGAFALRRIEIWGPLEDIGPTSTSTSQLVGGLAIAVQVLIGVALIVSAVMARSVSTVAAASPATSSPRTGAPAGHGASGPTRSQTWSAVALAVVLSVLVHAPSLAAYHAAHAAEVVRTEAAQRPLTFELPVAPACQQATDLATFCGPVSAIALSANGRWLVSLGDGRFMVWDLGARRLAWEVPVTTSSLGGAQVLVSGDGAHMVLTDGASVTVFKSNGDSPVPARCQDSTPQALDAVAVAFSRDESALAIATSDVCLFALDGTAPPQQLGPGCAATGVTFAEAGKALWVACANELRRYALPSGQLTRVVKAEGANSVSSSARLPMPSSFDALESSSDGARVLTLGTLPAPAPGANSMSTAPTPQGRDHGVWQWDAKAGQPLKLVRLRWFAGAGGGGALQAGVRPGQAINGQIPLNGFARPDPRTAAMQRSVAPLRVAWFPSLVVILGSGQVFDLQTGAPVHPPDMMSAQLIATARDEGVVAIVHWQHSQQVGPTLFVRPIELSW